MGVGAKDDCAKLPEPLRAGCEWRFDWLKDAAFPRYVKLCLLEPHVIHLTLHHSANFKRVVCPSELTAKTGCVRTDDDVLAGKKAASPAPAPPAPSFPAAAGIVAAVVMGLLSA
jgi:hypothetical protein